jgi:hypothetical protein
MRYEWVLLPDGSGYILIDTIKNEKVANSFYQKMASLYEPLPQQQDIPRHLIRRWDGTGVPDFTWTTMPNSITFSVDYMNTTTTVANGVCNDCTNG